MYLGKVPQRLYGPIKHARMFDGATPHQFRSSAYLFKRESEAALPFVYRCMKLGG